MAKESDRNATAIWQGRWNSAVYITEIIVSDVLKSDVLHFFFQHMSQIPLFFCTWNGSCAILRLSIYFGVTDKTFFYLIVKL